MELHDGQFALVGRLCRALMRSESQFALFFAVVNLPLARKEIARQTAARLQRPVVALTVPSDLFQRSTLDGWLLQQLEGAAADGVVFLCSLDQALPAEKNLRCSVLQQLNWRRSALATAVRRPLVLWLPRHAKDGLAEHAPDFHDWYSNVYEFEVSIDETMQLKEAFAAEFATTVHPSSRLSKTEKQQWLDVLLALLEEQQEQNGYRAKLLNEAGMLHRSFGNLEDALELLRQSLEIMRAVGDKSGEAATLNNISQIYDARGDQETALSYLNKSLEIRRAVGDKSGEAATLNNISQIYDARGDYETALSYLNKSLEIRRAVGDKSGEAATLNNIALISKARGDYETALSYLNKSLEIMRAVGDASGLCATLFNLGHMHLQNKEVPEAVKCWVRTYLLARRIGNAEALQALEGLVEQLGLEGGLDAWSKLAEGLGSGSN